MANADVLNLKTASGEKLNAGSTLVAVMLDSSRNLYWNSVGDSRLYLFRDGDFAQITQDHNYTTVLLEKLNAGMIDREEFNSENLKGEALISFWAFPVRRLLIITICRCHYCRATGW